jgi:RNA polymerase sigma factor (TIGR02999 family)
MPSQLSRTDVTTLLHLWSAGDDRAFERLMPLVHADLKRMAFRYLASERPDVMLEPNALVNEVCVRLLGWEQESWKNRGHFYGVSAQMMRHVLVDIARRRRTERRGGPGAIRVPLEDIDVAAPEPDVDLVEVDDALRRLAAEDSRKARVVELRFFGGLNMQDIADALEVSERTVQREWMEARAWLYRALSPTPHALPFDSPHSSRGDEPGSLRTLLPDHAETFMASTALGTLSQQMGGGGWATTTGRSGKPPNPRE